MSRAKAHIKRETDATTLKFDNVMTKVIIMTIIVDAALDPVLFPKVSRRLRFYLKPNAYAE